MKKNLVPFFILSFLILISVSVVSAQTPASPPQFPFTINGQTCNTKEECRVLCQDPVNRSVCSTLNPNQSNESNRFDDPTFATAAKEALGCSTKQSCKAVCSLAANFQKCDEFAQANQLTGGYDKRVIQLSQLTDDSEVSDEELAALKAIKDQLAGSDQTLKEYCEMTEHQSACSTLAKRFRLNGGERLNGPGGCQSPATCRLYCDDPKHFAECKSFEIPGLNGCTSELACYTEVQANAGSLESSLISDDTESSDEEDSLDTEEITKACADVTSSYQGKSVADFSSDISKSDLCHVLPKSGVPGKNSNCDAYLNSNQPFDQTIFEKICSVSPVVAVKKLDEVDVETAENGLENYSAWCKELPSVGQSESTDWEVVPSLCQNFVSTFQQARQECQKPADQRADWLSDEISYTRYCLSAPQSTSDYVASCKENPTVCKNEGFDWYCAQTGKNCIPLYQGRPIDQAVETFADAGVVKDGDQVSLVLDESTQEFAENALSEVIAESGAGGTFKVVSELPDQLSPEAVFVSGTGVDQRNGNRSKTFFKPTSFISRGINITSSLVISETPQNGEARPFAQPWFLTNAYQTDSIGETNQRAVTPQISPGLEAPKSPQTGWGSVKQNEQKLREEAVRFIEKKIPEGGLIFAPKQEMQVDPNLFRPQVSPQSGGSVINDRLRPTEILKRVEPTGVRSGSDFKPSPTRTLEAPRPTQINTSGSGGTFTTTGQSPTNPPRLEPTKAQEETRPPVIEPTKPPENRETTQTNTQTTTGSTSTTTGTTSTGTTTTTIDGTRVQGIHTEENVFSFMTQLARSFLGI